MDNRIIGVQEPLFARAMAVRRDAALVVYCTIELMAVSLAIREAVLAQLAEEELGLGEHNVMLTATHTHSGPSGYSHYFFLNLNGPGFSPPVFNAAVGGAVEAIKQAVLALQPGVLRVGRGEMPLDEPVAFNRSWFAYNLNEDVETVSKDRRDEAVDRTMTVLAADTSEGEPLGCLAWYPVHATSVHAENDQLHSDNKGIASTVMEHDGGSGYVAVHAQEASGDVTPNFRYDRARKKVIGKYDDDYRSAEFNGRLQARLAERVIREARPVKGGAVKAGTHYVDYSKIEVLERYSGVSGARTTHGMLGISMAEGTDEGPGPLLALRPVTRRLAKRKAKKGTDDPKVPMLEVGRGLDGRFLGLFSLRNMRIPALEPTIRYIRSVVSHPDMEEHPWVPQVLPLQIMQLGSILIVGLPFEITTVAGRRLRAQVRRLFSVQEVIINSYANAYAGYCTTYEEYQLQHYEAGYTLFGPHQLAATMTMLEWMHDHWEGELPLGVLPPVFSDEALARRLFTPWQVPRAERPW